MLLWMRRYIPPSRWQLWMARYCKAGEISLALGLASLSPRRRAMESGEYFSYRKYDWFWRLSRTFYDFLKMLLLFNILRIFLIFAENVKIHCSSYFITWKVIKWYFFVHKNNFSLFHKLIYILCTNVIK